MGMRTFWRIIFDVVDTPLLDGSVVPRPRLCAEMVLWSWDSEYASRLGRVMVELPIDLVGDVTFTDGAAHFAGGYIKGLFHRTALEEELVALAESNLERVEFGDLSNPFNELNVSIEALVRLLDDGAPQERPLFYMAQPSTDGIMEAGGSPTDAVLLLEKLHPGGRRTVQWSISGDYHQSTRLFEIIDPPDNESPRGWHRIRVQQDVGPQDVGTGAIGSGHMSAGGLGTGDEITSSRLFVYEILVDSLSLSDPVPARPPSHYFYDDPVEVYIGGKPDSTGDIVGLYGAISYLEFDPNNSCSNCAN